MRQATKQWLLAGVWLIGVIMFIFGTTQHYEDIKSLGIALIIFSMLLFPSISDDEKKE